MKTYQLFFLCFLFVSIEIIGQTNEVNELLISDLQTIILLNAYPDNLVDDSFIDPIERSFIETCWLPLLHLIQNKGLDATVYNKQIEELRNLYSSDFIKFLQQKRPVVLHLYRYMLYLANNNDSKPTYIEKTITNFNSNKPENIFDNNLLFRYNEYYGINTSVLNALKENCPNVFVDVERKDLDMKIFSIYFSSLLLDYFNKNLDILSIEEKSFSDKKEFVLYQKFYNLLILISKYDPKNIPENYLIRFEELTKFSANDRIYLFNKVPIIMRLFQSFINNAENNYWDMCTKWDIALKEFYSLNENRDQENIRILNHYDKIYLINDDFFDEFNPIIKKKCENSHIDSLVGNDNFDTTLAITETELLIRAYSAKQDADEIFSSNPYKVKPIEMVIDYEKYYKNSDLKIKQDAIELKKNPNISENLLEDLDSILKIIDSIEIEYEEKKIEALWSTSVETDFQKGIRRTIESLVNSGKISSSFAYDDTVRRVGKYGEDILITYKFGESLNAEITNFEKGAYKSDAIAITVKILLIKLEKFLERYNKYNKNIKGNIKGVADGYKVLTVKDGIDSVLKYEGEFYKIENEKYKIESIGDVYVLDSITLNKYDTINNIQLAFLRAFCARNNLISDKRLNFIDKDELKIIASETELKDKKGKDRRVEIYLVIEDFYSELLDDLPENDRNKLKKHFKLQNQDLKSTIPDGMYLLSE